MTESEIQKYIDLLNSNQYEDQIFKRPIGDYVEVANVWSEQPKITDNIIGNFYSYRFFFIRNQSGKYIGAVLDMQQDLHWFITPEYRGQGHLSLALKGSILPYLFEDRDFQRITIVKSLIGEVNYKASKKVALSLGFSALDESDELFELKIEDFDWSFESLNDHNPPLNNQRIDELKKRIFYAYKLTYQISDELNMSFGHDNRLKEIADELRKYTWKIDDLVFENE